MKNFFAAGFAIFVFILGDNLFSAAPPNIGSRLSNPLPSGATQALQGVTNPVQDACKPVYDKLKILNKCPQDQNNDCIHFPIALVAQGSACLLSMSANEQPANEDPAGLMVCSQGTNRRTVGTLDVYWSSSNHMMISETDILHLPHYPEFSSLDACQLFATATLQPYIVFDHIDYPAANIVGILNTPAPSPSDLLALSRLPTRVVAANTVQPEAPAGDPSIVPPDSNNNEKQLDEPVDNLQTSELESSGTGGCTLYPHLPVTGWWAGLGGFLIFIGILFLTRKAALARVKRKRKR